MSEVERRRRRKIKKSFQSFENFPKTFNNVEAPFQPVENKKMFKNNSKSKIPRYKMDLQVRIMKRLQWLFKTMKMYFLIIILLIKRLERAATMKHFMTFQSKKTKVEAWTRTTTSKTLKTFVPPNPGPILCSWAALFGSFRPLPCYNTLCKTYFRSRTYTRLCLVGKLEHEKDDVCFAQVKKRK